jgi:hypothetical protein
MGARACIANVIAVNAAKTSATSCVLGEASSMDWANRAAALRKRAPKGSLCMLADAL